ncbi:TIGR01777 family oxidoreductase [Chloroflexi bacterium]|nr:TIGR01777 family oxidoreductase [Chloroflexota bacterium]
MNVIIAGATGFIGSELVSFLRGKGHSVKALVRNTEKASEQLGAGISLLTFGDSDDKLASAFEGTDAIVNLTGRPLAPARWSKSKKRDFYESRVGVTERIVSIMENCEAPPAVLISASAVGYYGDRGDEEITEESEIGQGYLSQLCDSWEKAALEAQNFGTRVCTLRLGVVLGRESGFLNQLSTSFEMGVGSYVGDGRQWVPWIHYSDLLRIIDLTINDEGIFGPINCTAPNPVTSKGFSKCLAKILGTKIVIGVPSFCLKLVFADGETVLTNSQNALPHVLLRRNFKFNYEELEKALIEECAPSGVSIVKVNSIKQPFDPSFKYSKQLSRADYKIETSVSLAVNSETAFNFFSSPLNLGLATPKWMGFHITESPAEVIEGSEFEYKIKLGILPIKWRTEIVKWSPDDLFIDYQKRGPYRLWWHQHRIVAEGDSNCRMEDKVFYKVPGWILGRVVHKYMIKNMLVRIFSYRRKVIQMRFGSSEYDE